MPSIKLQFSAQNKIGSMLIRWRDWSDYSHVDTVLPDGSLLGARGDSVKIRAPYKTSKKLILCIEVTKQQEKDYYAALFDQLLKPYDYAGIFGFVANRDWQEDDKWFCSELVMYCLMKAGIKILNVEHLSRITSQHMILSTFLNRCE
jgi:uncharacterized protein YycO